MNGGIFIIIAVRKITKLESVQSVFAVFDAEVKHLFKDISHELVKAN